MDHFVNIRKVVASFYVGTGGIDIGLMMTAVGDGGESLGKCLVGTLKKYAVVVLYVVDEVISRNLEEELELTK